MMTSTNHLATSWSRPHLEPGGNEALTRFFPLHSQRHQPQEMGSQGTSSSRWSMVTSPCGSSSTQSTGPVRNLTAPLTFSSSHSYQLGNPDLRHSKKENVYILFLEERGWEVEGWRGFTICLQPGIDFTYRYAFNTLRWRSMLSRRLVFEYN